MPAVRSTARDALADPRIARALAAKYLVWDAYVAGRRRVELSPLVLGLREHRAAVAAAEAAHRAAERVSQLAFDEPNERARYGLAPDVVRLARASWDAGDREVLSRVDLLLGEDGTFRACEINADCPGGHNEAYGLPRLLREVDPAAGAAPGSVLAITVERLRVLAGGRTVALVHATAYPEDVQVCALFERALGGVGVRAVRAPPTALVRERGALRLWGEEIGALYRYFPTEGMSGQANVDGLVEAIASKEVRTLSSFAAIHTQSKLSMARAWARLGVAEAGIFPETHALDAAWAERVISEREDWVLKRAFGRVGDEVFVGALVGQDAFSDVVAAALETVRRGDVWIVQRFFRQRAVPTPWGPRLVTLGAYLSNGRFAGYFARLSPTSHASHDAVVVPVVVEGP